ncbi:MAG: response regulator transcription factor [Gemmatimonadales bacterium]|jgi:DNA-binding NarL/FixJ family response regulator
MPDSAARILIVDDHSIVRRGLSLLLNQERDLTVCGEAGDAEATLRAIEADRPDLVIVDIALGGADGLELIKQVRARWPDIRMLALSMHSESLYAQRSLQAGAHGYLMKERAPEEVLDALRRVLAGGVYVSDELQRAWLGRLVSRREQGDRLPIQTLTDRELAVLRLMGLGYGTHEAAAALNLSMKTVQTYHQHIKRKLGLETGADLARFATLWLRSESGG